MGSLTLSLLKGCQHFGSVFLLYMHNINCVTSSISCMDRIRSDLAGYINVGGYTGHPM